MYACLGLNELPFCGYGTAEAIIYERCAELSLANVAVLLLS